MTAGKSWTISWNKNAKQFFARYRRIDGRGWGTQRIPKGIASGTHQRLGAERWMTQWYLDHAKTGGLAPVVHQIKPVAKTLTLLTPRWLKFRCDDPGTAINTYEEFEKVVRNWVLDGGKREHVSIQDLDMEREFTSEVCLSWMRSLRGNGSTPLRYAQVLKVIFEDCIGNEWLDPDMSNPFRRPVVAKEFKRLKERATENRPVIYLSTDQVAVLLTRVNTKIRDLRRLRYLVVLAAGLREEEVQGLVWSDIRFDHEVPHVRVERQLLKPGPKPFVQYETLRDQGVGKADIMKRPNAVVSAPKRKSRRSIPLVPLVLQALRYWHDIGWKLHVGVAPRDDDPVFPNGKDSPHYPAGRFYEVSSALLLRLDLERAELPPTIDGRNITFHALRRTFATMLEAGGVERSRIGELLGHKAQDVASQHYLGTVLAARASALAKLSLPDHVQLRSRTVYAPGAEPKSAKADVIDLARKTRKRAIQGAGKR